MPGDSYVISSFPSMLAVLAAMIYGKKMKKKNILQHLQSDRRFLKLTYLILLK